jgi:protein-S-isoprenylcysteine O-methyltransferase Ste14
LRRGVLGFLELEIAAALTFVATVAVVLVGLGRRARPTRRVRVVAKREPPLWTEVLWVLGAVEAVFWPIGFFLLPQLAYHWPPFPDFPGSVGFQIAGVFLAVLGGLLFTSGARALGTQMTPAIQVQEGHRLLQEGPYRYIRHPVYTAILTIALGQTLLFLSPLAALLFVILLALAVYRARLEEELLRSPEAFGATYDAYIARTGRFLPRLRREPDSRAAARRPQ